MYHISVTYGCVTRNNRPPKSWRGRPKTHSRAKECRKFWTASETVEVMFCLHVTNPSSSYLSDHHHHREVLTDRCAPPWPLATSDLHIVDNSLASASWMWLSHVRRGRPEGLVQVVDGFLPSWPFTMSWRAAFAGTLGSRRAMWPNRDWRRLSRMSLMSGRPDLWSTSALEICCHHWMSSICRWHFIWNASSVFTSADRSVHVSAL